MKEASLVLLILMLATAFGQEGYVAATPATAQDARGKWVGHPAIAPFAVVEQDLPSELFLVRTRGRLPEVVGLVVYGVHDGLFLVSVDPGALRELVERGCGVTPLQPVDSTPRAPARTWALIDTPDPAIAAMVDEVDSAGVMNKIQWLVDMGPRCAYWDNFDVADSIGDMFASYGLTPVVIPVPSGSFTFWNVEAVQSGSVYPDSFFIICGHLDSGGDCLAAVGADDNGSGVAAVLTAAEILTPHEFEYSIRYVCFDDEEGGHVGSRAYAAWAVDQGLGIAGVLNFDMIGYWVPGVDRDLEIETNISSQWLADAITNAADLYTGSPYELHVDNSATWSDHASFWAKGYAAVNHEEAWAYYAPDFNPYYHTSNDLPSHISASFTVDNIQIGIAALATLAVPIPEGTGIDGRITPPLASGAVTAFPNPFYEKITFKVTGVSDRGSVKVLVFDVRGRRVDEVPVVLSNGQGTAQWIMSDPGTRNIGAGVYFAKLEESPASPPVKIVYIK